MDYNRECEFTFTNKDKEGLGQVTGKTPPAPGVKPAAQKRSQETRDKLVAALETLLRSKAFDEISVAEIAAEAGLAVGTVYRRFENKDAFIPVIFEIYMARQNAFNTNPETQVRIDPTEGLRACLRSIARQGWAFMTEQAHIIRTAHLYARLRPDLVGEEWDALLEASVEGFVTALTAFPDEVKRPQGRQTAEVLSYLFNTIFIEKGLHPQDGPAAVVSLEGDAFAEEMADIIYAYLILPAEG